MARRLWLFVVGAMLLAPVAAGAQHVQAGASADDFLRRARAFMRQMAAGNAADAKQIAAAYGAIAAQSSLRDRASLVDAIDGGRLVPVPDGASSVRLALRRSGPHPIGELDLAHQELYLAAHPATIETLLRLSTSVTTGPIEVTSLVRHGDYQRRLARTNVNATRRASLHTLGLAFDVSILNVPSSTAREIGDLLVAMRRAGDVFFIAETQQLVFHVVPTPARLDDFAAVTATTRAAGEPRRVPHPPRVVAAGAAPVSLLIVPPSATFASALWSIPIGAGLLACAARLLRRACA